MKINTLWTNLTPKSISKLLKIDYQIEAGVYIVKQLFKVCGYVKRKMRKNKTLKIVEDRNEQFEHIAALKSKFISQNLPILSIDSKKKEMVGNFYRDGKLQTKELIEVNDHDFLSFAEGVVIPHGIFDLQKNKCFLTLGTSKDTAEFVVDNLEYFWIKSIKEMYGNPQEILILCDGGGSNSCLHYVFKEQLQKLAQRLEIEIVVAHYPAYCSKWNPIEHKVFCHLTRNWQGVPFRNYQIIKDLAEKTTTTKGLSIEARINTKEYKTGVKASDKFREEMPVIFSDFQPKRNYRFEYKP